LHPVEAIKRTVAAIAIGIPIALYGFALAFAWWLGPPICCGGSWF
jgi:hypothetical protein